MAKERLIRRILPRHLYDMEGLEEWFQEMAAKGLHLVKVGPYGAKFRPGPPAPQIRYRLDVPDYWGEDPERARAYKEGGWEYVDTIGRIYSMFRADDPDAPELHSDPVTQSYAMKRLWKRSWIFLASNLAVALIVFRGDVAKFFQNPCWLTGLLIQRTWAALLYLGLLALYLLVVFVPTLRQLWTVRRLWKRLSQGLPLERRPRRRVLIPAVVRDCGVLAVLPWVILAAIALERTTARNLEFGEALPCPHLTLEQVAVEDGRELTLDDMYDKMPRPDTFRTSPLAPVQYTWNQGGQLGWGPGSSHLYLYGEYIQTRSPELAAALLPSKELETRNDLRKYEKNRGSVTLSSLEVLQEYTPLSHSGFDELLELRYRYQDEQRERHYYLGRQGSQVMFLSCAGDLDLQACLDRMAEQMARQEGM